MNTDDIIVSLDAVDCSKAATVTTLAGRPVRRSKTLISNATSYCSRSLQPHP
jgi:hypothetical protein